MPDEPVILVLSRAEADALRQVLRHLRSEMDLDFARLLLAVLDKLPAPEGG
jgi:hypothetical protein